MSKSKVITFSFLFGLILIVLIEWSSLRGKMYDYNYSDVAKQIEIESLSFETKIPTKVPFEEMYVYESRSDGEKQVTVRLFNKHKNALDIRIASNIIDYKDDLKQKDVRIGKNLEGVFISNDSGKRILSWKDEGINYEITYYSKLTPKEISKQQLIKMAESFE